MISSRRDVAQIWLTRTCVKPLILSRNAWHRHSQSAALMRPAWRVQQLNARPVVWLWLSLRSKTSNNNPAAAGRISMIRSSNLALAALLSLAAWTSASAEQPGITETEIKFGNIMPYSGPASALSVTGKAFAGYFDLVNEKG